jgi:hypothetical protein
MSALDAHTILALLRNAFWTWLHRLGGPGLLMIGIIDASALPLPGSIDHFSSFWWRSVLEIGPTTFSWLRLEPLRADILPIV